MIPLFVAVNMKSLLTAIRWMSNPVEKDPVTALLEWENTCHARKFVHLIKWSVQTYSMNNQISCCCLLSLLFHQPLNHQQTEDHLEHVGNKYFVSPTFFLFPSRKLLMWICSDPPLGYCNQRHHNIIYPLSWQGTSRFCWSLCALEHLTSCTPVKIQFSGHRILLTAKDCRFAPVAVR